MKLLGALGLDWKILIIQAINFLILFFILKELFFKPFVRALKEEKEKTERLKKAEGAISQEKENWQREKEKELMEAKIKVEKILSEAERMNRMNKEKMKEEEIKQEKETIERIRKQSQAILADYRKSLDKNYRERIRQSLLKIFDQYLSRGAKTEIQSSFWQNFVKKLREIEPSEIAQISQGKPALQAIESLPPEIRKDIQLKKIPLAISSAYPLSSYQRKSINSIFKEKIPGKNFSLKEKKEPNLIAGFRWEIGGLLVEESLREKLEQIFH